MRELMWNKRRLSVDPKGTLRSIRRELDDRTDRLYNDVVARRNKEVYIKARE